MRIDIKQLEFVDQQLRDMAIWVEEVTGFELTVTSLYRIGDDGVHGTLPVRGLDLRCRSNEIGLSVEALINRYWIYDESRPHLKCCLVHGDGSNLHFHLQVHPKTEFKG